MKPISIVRAVLALAVAASLNATVAFGQNGTVTLSGNAVSDANGPFLGLGFSYMTALRRCKFDRNRLNSDCAFMASKEYKYARILSMVGWFSAWQGKEIAPVSFTSQNGTFVPAWSDYDQQLRDVIDIIYSHGMRTELTIFADAQLIPTFSARQGHCDRVLAAISGREHKIMHLEVANEAWQNGFSGSQGITDLRNLCSYLTARTNILTAISATEQQTNAGLTTMYSGSTADIATEHFSRQMGVDGGWKPVWDCWRCEEASGVPACSNNEPIGPGSSVDQDTDPIRLVMAAAFSWGANLPLYVYHTDAGVFGDTTFQSKQAVGDYIHLNNLLPGDFAAWTRNDGKESAAPFTNFSNGQANRWWPEVGGATNGAVRNTGKNNGASFYTLPIGILGGGLTMQARRPVSWTAYNPLTGAAAASATMNTNAQFTLPQGPRAYILNGVYTDSVNSVTVNLDTVDIQRGIANISCCDGNNEPWPIGGRMSRANVAASDHYMYFNVSDGYTLNGNKPNQTITVDYFDNSTNSLNLQYDSTSGPYKVGPSVTLTNTQTWKTVVWTVNDAYFGNRLNGGTDFRIFYTGLDFYLDNVTAAVAAAGQGPFGGTARAIPGTIQAEDYDTGGQNVAYGDTSGGNFMGAYRADDVDIEACGDTGGGFNVGFIAPGEWLEYTVNVASTGDYTIKARLASGAAGGTFNFTLNGNAISGDRTIASTGGWQSYTTITIPACFMTAGSNQILRFNMVTDGMNINKFDITNGGADAVHVDLASSVHIDGMDHVVCCDGMTTGATIGGHNCRRNTNNGPDRYMYFSISDIYAFQGSRPNVWITAEYYDTGTSTLTLTYDSSSSPYQNATGNPVLVNSNTWKTKSWNVTNGYFGNRQNGGADFRLNMSGSGTWYIDTVQTSLAQP